MEYILLIFSNVVINLIVCHVYFQIRYKDILDKSIALSKEIYSNTSKTVRETMDMLRKKYDIK